MKKTWAVLAYGALAVLSFLLLSIFYISYDNKDVKSTGELFFAFSLFTPLLVYILTVIKSSKVIITLTIIYCLAIGGGGYLQPFDVLSQPIHGASFILTTLLSFVMCVKKLRPYVLMYAALLLLYIFFVVYQQFGTVGFSTSLILFIVITTNTLAMQLPFIKYFPDLHPQAKYFIWGFLGYLALAVIGMLYADVHNQCAGYGCIGYGLFEIYFFCTIPFFLIQLALLHSGIKKAHITNPISQAEPPAP